MVPDPEIKELLDNAEGLGIFGDGLMEQSQRLREQADSLIEKAKELARTERERRKEPRFN